jgi:hypothetical protein
VSSATAATRGEPVRHPDRWTGVTPTDRAAILADPEASGAYPDPTLTAAQAILDDAELGPRVAAALARPENA